MKRYMLLLSMLIIGALLTNACSDDKSTNKPDETSTIYFPSANGSYWVNKNDDYASSDNILSFIDSTVITGTESLYGKNATVYTAYQEGSPYSTTQYYYTDGTKLYALASSLLRGSLKSIFPPDMLPDEWVAVTEAKVSGDWTIFKKNYNDYTYEVNGNVITISGDFEVVGTNKGNIEVETPAGTFDAIQNDMTIKFNGTLDNGIESIPLNFAIVSTVYYSENVGQIKMEMKKQSIFMGDEKVLDIRKSKTTLLRYNIVK